TAAAHADGLNAERPRLTQPASRITSRRSPVAVRRPRVTCHVSLLFRRLAAAFGAALVLAASADAAELKIGLSADVTTLDPHFLAAQPNLTVARHVFESLTDVDAKTRLIPGLAESWRAVDATTWEFKLAQGVRFHDGSELT